MAERAIDLCRAVAGGRSRKCKVVVSGSPKRLTSYWDGGSKDTFYGVELVSRRRVDLPATGSPFYPERAAYQPVAGVAVVEHSIFCGKDVGYTLHLHPDDAGKFV